MSASLVGSEMCIRDSPRGALRALSGRSPGRSLWRSLWRSQGTLGVLSAVSYTHLTLPTICSV
eukprot:10744151-Alexandrium_andersonii.AAC.1